jgi:hypothetical protein
MKKNAMGRLCKMWVYSEINDNVKLCYLFSSFGSFNKF